MVLELSTFVQLSARTHAVLHISVQVLCVPSEHQLHISLRPMDAGDQVSGAREEQNEQVLPCACVEHLALRAGEPVCCSDLWGCRAFEVGSQGQRIQCIDLLTPLSWDLGDKDFNSQGTVL